MSTWMPGSREEDAWLSDRELAHCLPADEADSLRSPIPTQMVSNGEYMPYPQTEKQKLVEYRINELADKASKRLGMSRRRFLASTGGMAAAFLAMNEVFGHFFKVSPVEMFESAAYAETGAPEGLFVLDDQLHMVRYTQSQGRSLRAVAQGPGPASTNAGFLVNPNNPTMQGDEFGNPWTPWNPLLDQIPNTGADFHLVQFIKDVFLSSQVTVGILSNANLGSIPVPGQPSGRPPKSITEDLAVENLTGFMTAAVRDFVNDIAGSTRLLAHGQLYPGIGNLHDPVYGDFIQWQVDTFHPDSWKGYCIATAAKVDLDPNSAMRMWRLDDEAVAYPMFQSIANNAQELKAHPGFFNICIHKGLAPGPPDIPERGNPTDIPKAAKDWPQFNFIIYHSCIRNGFFDLDSLQSINSGAMRGGVPDISWTTQFAQLARGLPNVYAELGTTFAGSVVTFPTVCAHILGQLLKYMGPNRICFGSDSLWYGSPQWQIDAFWRFQIPEALQRKWHYPALTDETKRKILGVNAAKLYRLNTDVNQPGDTRPDRGVQYQPVPANYESLIPAALLTTLEYQGQANDNFSKARREYLAAGGPLGNTRYGWIRRPV
jgi:hypothetical protein